MDFDGLLRQQIYTHTTERGKPPAIAELSDATSAPQDRVRESLARLAAGRILVLQRESGEILMAPPFSAVPTPYLVHADGRRWHANCAWDAFGVCVVLGGDGRIEYRDIVVEVRGCRPDDESLVFQCLVPAAHWWDDIVYT